MMTSQSAWTNYAAERRGAPWLVGVRVLAPLPGSSRFVLCEPTAPPGVGAGTREGGVEWQKAAFVDGMRRYRTQLGNISPPIHRRRIELLLCPRVGSAETLGQTLRVVAVDGQMRGEDLPSIGRRRSAGRQRSRRRPWAVWLLRRLQPRGVRTAAAFPCSSLVQDPCAATVRYRTPHAASSG